MQRRLPLIAFVVLVLSVLIVVDRNSDHHPPVDVVADKALMPVASPPGAVSSAFFCAGGAAAPGAAFDATIVIANAGATNVSVLLTSYPAALASDPQAPAVAALKPVAKQVTVNARSRAEVHLAELQQSPFAAAVVETNAPDIAVERRVISADGSMTSTSACASSPSDTWFFPTGTTTRDARELFAVFNPFPVDAVVDVSFHTSDGFRQPPDLSGLPIPQGQLRILDISASVPRIEQLAGSVRARAGRVIVDRLQSFDGSDPKHPAGLAATLGAPSPASVWTFGEGLVSDGLNEDYSIFNPSDATAAVRLEITYDDPSVVSEPLELSVPPRSYAPVVMGDQTRVLRNATHSVTVRSTNATGVVVERVITGVPPAARQGYAPALGASLVATRWLFADGKAVADQMAEYVIVVNPSSDAVAHVDFTALASGQALAIDGLQNVEVPPGGRVAVELGQHVNRPDLPLLLESDTPIVAERGLYAANGKGIALAAGMPLAEDAALPPRPPPSTSTSTTLAPPLSS